MGRALAEPGPASTVVRGRSGTGRTALVGRAVPTERRVLWHEVVRLGPDAQLALLRNAWTLGSSDPLPAGLAEDRDPLVLVLDGVEHVADPDRLAALLAELWAGARARALPLHLVLVGTAEALGTLAPDDSSLGRAATRLDLGPLAPHEIAAALDAWPPSERLLAWAVFGGLPERIRHLDPSVRLSTNVQRLVLDPGGPLHRGAPDTLARLFQKPERYAGLVRALALGARDWTGLREAVPEFRASSQMAPYVASLDEQGLVRAERSLDARPGSRNRRYRLTDPYLGFWYRSVLPRLGALSRRDPALVWREEVRGEAEAWATLLFPLACRSVLGRRGERVLPARARETGALWGGTSEIPIAATLRNGAVVYGAAVRGRRATRADAESLAAAVRETRYGFGREARVRVVFTADGAEHDLRRAAARDPLLELVSWQDMIGA